MAAVGQQDFAQIARAGGRKDMARETFLSQQRQVTAMVKMRMGEQHCMDRLRQHRQWIPVAQAQLFEALKQSAIDQQAFALVLHQIFGAGDRICPT